jgi:hypothetical protein
VFAVLLIGPSHLSAGEKTNQIGAADPGAKASRFKVPVWERHLPEINWYGQPLDEIVKTFRQEFPEINFVVTGRVGSEAVSGAVLRDVTLGEIFKALEPATEGRIRVTWNPDDRLVIFDKPPVIVSGDPVICRVFNVSRFLGDREGKEADAAFNNITEAVQTAWSMLREANGDQTEPPPRLSLHRGTKLLIVVGRVYAVNVVEDIVKQLQGTAPARNIPLPPDAQREGKSKKPNPAESP